MLTGSVAFVYGVSALCVSFRILPLASGLLLILSLPLVSTQTACSQLAGHCRETGRISSAHAPKLETLGCNAVSRLQVAYASAGGGAADVWLADAR